MADERYSTKHADLVRADASMEIKTLQENVSIPGHVNEVYVNTSELSVVHTMNLLLPSYEIGRPINIYADVHANTTLNVVGGGKTIISGLGTAHVVVDPTAGGWTISTVNILEKLVETIEKVEELEDLVDPGDAYLVESYSAAPLPLADNTIYVKFDYETAVGNADDTAVIVPQGESNIGRTLVIRSEITGDGAGRISVYGDAEEANLLASGVGVDGYETAVFYCHDEGEWSFIYRSIKTNKNVDWTLSDVTEASYEVTLPCGTLFTNFVYEVTAGIDETTIVNLPGSPVNIGNTLVLNADLSGDGDAPITVMSGTDEIADDVGDSDAETLVLYCYGAGKWILIARIVHE